MHLVLKSELARGEYRLTTTRVRKFLASLLTQLSKENHVKVYEYGIETTHVHLLIRPKTRDGFQSFLRQLSGRLAQCVTGARRGKPFGRFWTKLAWSRIVEWCAFSIARHYVKLNQLEGLNLIPRRKKALP